MATARRIVKTAFPESLQPVLFRSYLRAMAVRYAGKGIVCPCCNRSFRQFGPYRIGPSSDTICPGCGALARHRMLMLFLEQRTQIFTEPLRVLHVAPEPCIQRRLVDAGVDYRSMDLGSAYAEDHMDITDLTYPDGSFDAIICFHVLEHIPEDRQAMAELYRVLTPGGWAIIDVPLSLDRERTLEDPSVRSAQERERLFGQRDHVRRYGADLFDRLAAAGFSVALDPFPAEIDEATATQHGLRAWRRGMIVCTKPADVAA